MSYINCPEEMKIIADGSRPMKRWEGTCVMAYGVEGNDFKKIRALLAAHGIYVPDMTTHLKRCGFFTTKSFM